MYQKAKKITDEFEKRQRIEREKRIKEENKSFIGKYFKFRNFYSSSDEGWWLYIKVVGVKDTDLIVEEFEETEHGRIEITTAPHGVIGEGQQFDHLYMPITELEYQSAKKRILSKLELMKNWKAK